LAEAGNHLRRAIEGDPHLVDKLTAIEREVLILGHGNGPIARAEHRADQIDRELRQVERESRPEDQIVRRAFSMEEYVARPPVDSDDDNAVPGVLYTVPEGGEDDAG
jgi:hypothetical protein